MYAYVLFVGDEPLRHTPRLHGSVVTTGGELMIQGSSGKDSLENLWGECALECFEALTTVSITLGLASVWTKSIKSLTTEKDECIKQLSVAHLEIALISHLAQSSAVNDAAGLRK